MTTQGSKIVQKRERERTAELELLSGGVRPAQIHQRCTQEHPKLELEARVCH